MVLGLLLECADLVDLLHDLFLLLLEPAAHAVVVLRGEIDAGLLPRRQQVPPQPLNLLSVLLRRERDGLEHEVY